MHIHIFYTLHRHFLHVHIYTNVPVHVNVVKLFGCVDVSSCGLLNMVMRRFTVHQYITSLPVGMVRYSAGILEWTKAELREMDVRC